MGNCCTKPKQKQEPKPPPQEVPPAKYIYIECSDPHYRAKVLYSADKPISDLLDQIELNTENYNLCKGASQISDFTATLRQLGIAPNITLKLVKQPEQESKISVLPAEASNLGISLQEIAQEETTTKKQVGTIIPKHATQMLQRQDNHASSLWRTALCAQQPPRFQQGDTSSMSNITHDYSMKERKLPQCVPMTYKVSPHSVTVESDDSRTIEDGRRIPNTENVRHPTDFFRDLQGPFSVLKQL